MTAFDDMSPASADLIFAALDHAVENAGISDEGFTPFAFMDPRPRRSRSR